MASYNNTKKPVHIKFFEYVLTFLSSISKRKYLDTSYHELFPIIGS